MLFLPRSTIRIEVEEISEGPLYKDAELLSCCTVTRCWVMGRRCHEHEQACEIPRDTGYQSLQYLRLAAGCRLFRRLQLSACTYERRTGVELARHALHSQYCGALLYFAQYAERQEDAGQVFSETPGYEWVILCNSQPRSPYLPTT